MSQLEVQDGSNDLSGRYPLEYTRAQATDVSIMRYIPREEEAPFIKEAPTRNKSSRRGCLWSHGA